MNKQGAARAALLSGGYMEYESHAHPFAPVFDEKCRVLILGTFPSVKSRENAFYYGHPQNRFWKVLAAICEEVAPETMEEKTAMLLRRHIALWDVIAQCDIVGSGDSSIKNAVPNELSIVLQKASIEKVLLNGQTAGRLYMKHHKDLDLPYTVLPSTSPANAAWQLDKLTNAWIEALRPHIQD